MRIRLAGYLILMTVVLSSCSSSNEAPRSTNPSNTTWSSILVRVFDHNGTPVPSAAVFLLSALQDSQRIAISNADGVARITLLPTCTDCRLVVSLAGFATYEIDALEFGGGESLEFDVELEHAEGPFEVSTDCYPRDPSPLSDMPNQPFQTDRDPRERGSRPLNSNR